MRWKAAKGNAGGGEAPQPSILHPFFVLGHATPSRPPNHTTTTHTLTHRFLSYTKVLSKKAASKEGHNHHHTQRPTHAECFIVAHHHHQTTTHQRLPPSLASSSSLPTRRQHIHTPLSFVMITLLPSKIVPLASLYSSSLITETGGRPHALPACRVSSSSGPPWPRTRHRRRRLVGS